MPVRFTLVPVTASSMVLLAAGCGGLNSAAAHASPPTKPISVEELVGTWINGKDTVIQFQEDYTVVIGGDYDREKDLLSGETREALWRLCGEYPFDEIDRGEATVPPDDCDETDMGEWVQIDAVRPGDPAPMDDLVLTGEAGEGSLYSYDVATEPDEDGYFSKVDQPLAGLSR
ncbi:hypothetical protein [Salininema proteolyticum]|uniref:Lipoprotein n=1 Tax=Salininema proteolyticum TaxID=1607685 RepID=A0ABV8TU65_9ACTN